MEYICYQKFYKNAKAHVKTPVNNMQFENHYTQLMLASKELDEQMVRAFLIVWDDAFNSPRI